MTVSSDLESGANASGVVARLRPWLEAERQAWPVGYRYEFGDEEESSARANQSVTARAPAVGLIMLLLLVGQFSSVRRTAIVLLTIPLGLIGVVAGLLAAQSYFGFMTLLGILALAGIIINNAIVLIDRIRIEIDDNGLDPPRAVLETAQGRFRPILLSTATTVAGLLPLWFGGRPKWEPIAIAIIFGLLGATVLTPRRGLHPGVDGPCRPTRSWPSRPPRRKPQASIPDDALAISPAGGRGPTWALGRGWRCACAAGGKRAGGRRSRGRPADGPSCQRVPCSPSALTCALCARSTASMRPRAWRNWAASQSPAAAPTNAPAGAKTSGIASPHLHQSTPTRNS